jgi:hypothetical protein
MKFPNKVQLLSTIFFCLLSLSSCTMIYDFSRTRPYQDSIGNPLTLHKEAFLCPEKVYNFWGFSRQGFYMSDSSWGCAGDRVTDKPVVLPQGTPVVIDKVSHVSGMGGSWVYAYGRVNRPDTGKPVAFEYLWSSFPVKDLKFAPWEDQTALRQK